MHTKEPDINENFCKLSKIGAQFFLVCLFLFSTRFGRLCAYHQEKQLHLCDTWYLLFCMDDCLVQNNKYQVSHKHSYFS